MKSTLAVVLPIRVTLASVTSTATKASNASAGVTPLPNKGYSNEQLMLWAQVGSVSTHPTVTKLVEVTPEPIYTRPGFMHPLFPSAYGKNITTYKLPGALAPPPTRLTAAEVPHRVPGLVLDTNGDVLGQHYYLYKQDFFRLKALGTPWYSPSMSWPRLLPFGKGPCE